MTRWHSQLLLLISVVAVTSLTFAQTVQSENTNKTVLTVGYLTAIKGELKDKQGLAISGALTMALAEVLFQIFLFNSKNSIPNIIKVEIHKFKNIIKTLFEQN